MLKLKKAIYIFRWLDEPLLPFALRISDEENAIAGCQDIFLFISTCRFSLLHFTLAEHKCARVFNRTNRCPEAFTSYFMLSGTNTFDQKRL